MKLAEVYGSGYLDDVDYVKFNKRSTETHRDSMIYQLEKVVQAYDYALIALEL